MSETFVSEPLEPTAGTSDAGAMAAGEPGLPKGFVWRDRTYTVATVLEKWKESGPGKGGLRLYLRKHWYRLAMTDGTQMTVYFERQARSKGTAKSRWWLYTVTESEAR